ncbi:MAG: hypothetical protein QXV73_04110 [Candidatus Micrarchaeia archaeon]
MAIVVNETGRDIRFVYGGVQYVIKNGEEADIPDMVASLYLGYGLDKAQIADMIDIIISRVKACNPDIAVMTNKDIWDNIILKFHIGKKAIEEIKKKARK